MTDEERERRERLARNLDAAGQALRQAGHALSGAAFALVDFDPGRFARLHADEEGDEPLRLWDGSMDGTDAGAATQGAGPATTGALGEQPLPKGLPEAFREPFDAGRGRG